MPLPIHTIIDPNDPRLASFRQQGDAVLAGQAQILCDSEKVVKRALSQGLRMLTILADASFYGDHQELIASTLAEQDTELLCCSKTIAESIVGHRLHRGVMALAERPTDSDLNHIQGPIVILNGVNNSENVGLICRSALAFGFRHILVDEQSCTPWLRRAIRVSMGAVFKLGMIHCRKRPQLDRSSRAETSLADALAVLKARHYQLFGLDPSPDALNLATATLPRQAAIAIGCEGDGLSKRLRDRLDLSLSIPMSRQVDSLNAAHAFSIAAYEWHRQHALDQ